MKGGVARPDGAETQLHMREEGDNGGGGGKRITKQIHAFKRLVHCITVHPAEPQAHTSFCKGYRKCVSSTGGRRAQEPNEEGTPGPPPPPPSHTVLLLDPLQL